MRFPILMADFIISIVLALLTNIIAGYLQDKYALFTDQVRVGLVVLVFLFTVALGLGLTLIRARQAKQADRSTALASGAGLLVNDKAQIDRINVDDAAGQDIIEGPKTKLDTANSAGSTGVYIGSGAKVKGLTVKRVAGRNIIKRKAE